MVEAPSLRSDVNCDSETTDSAGLVRRLRILREQLQRENRRAAGPFSHPLAAHGPLSRLREQIRDVSRIADAVVTSAELAVDSRVKELCSDLRRLLQTQQAWTERLENQIWRLESQAVLMKRLQQVLMHGSPGTDQLWQLCELIARETQAVPHGLLLLPEPGQRIALPTQGVSYFAAMLIEQSRLGVFAGVSLLPEIRGAEIVAGTLQASASRVAGLPDAVCHEAATSEMLIFASRILNQTATQVPSGEILQLIHAATDFTANLERASLTSAGSIVPPGINEFYSGLCEQWQPQSGETGPEFVKLFLNAIGIGAESTNSRRNAGSDGDERLVLAHKLRWHDGASARFGESSEQETTRRVPRPHFLNAADERPRFSVFTE